MDKRKRELAALNEYIEKDDKETTLLLQNLQWDHKHMLGNPQMVSCKHEDGHRIPIHSVESHERMCFLHQQGYSKDDVLLPDALESNALNTVKLSKCDIMKIINAAAESDPTFKRGVGSHGAVEPLSAERLQQAYSADERRAIHDAVVAAAPSADHLDDLPLPSGGGGGSGGQARSRAALLAELRDMKRRRARYRVRSTTQHYSDVLRDLIRTQMELYAEAKGIFIKTEYGPKSYVSLETKAAENLESVVVKQERLSPDTDPSEKYRDKSTSRDWKRRTERHRDREETTDKRNSRDFNDDKYSKDRRRNDGHCDRERSHKSEYRNSYNNGNRREDSTSSKDSARHDEQRQQSKYSHKSYNSKTNRYDSSSSDRDKHNNCKERSSDGRGDHRRRHDEYDRHRKQSSRRHRDHYKNKYEH